MRWATSQASPLRRVHILGNLDLTGQYGANAFGTELADSKVDRTVISDDGTTGPAQAQYYTRDSQIGSWSGDGVNLVFSGVTGAPRTNFGAGGTTTLATTPTSRPAPFLTINSGVYEVFVPSARTTTSGANWSTASNAGVRIPVSKFYIAKPTTDTAATINAALASGKHLLLTPPGVYRLNGPIKVTRANTVVLGMGVRNARPPSGGAAAITIGDVPPGVVVSSIMIDASSGTDVLVQVGTRGATHVGDAVNPTALSDVFVRVGGGARRALRGPCSRSTVTA